MAAASSPVIKVAALCGSLREGSYNRSLLRAAIEISKSVSGLEIEYVDISPLPFLNTDLEVNGRFPEAVEAFREKIKAADSILFASPEYNYSVSGPLKNAIDWASLAPNVWADKSAAIVSAGGDSGGVRSQYHLRQIGVYLDLHFINKPEFFLNAFQCPAKFDSENNLTDEQTKERLKELLLSLYMFTLRLQACKSRNSRAKSSKFNKKADLTSNQSRRQQIVPRKLMLQIQTRNSPEAQNSLGQSGQVHIVPEITLEHQIGPDGCIQDTGGSMKGEKAPTWEELYLKYKTHANAFGFCVKKSTTRRLKSITKLAEIYFLCSCEGQSRSTLPEIANPSPLSGNELVLPCPVTGNQNTVKKRKRRVTFERTGCQARMRVKYSKKDDLYEVVKHVTEHNHPMTITEFNHLKQSEHPVSEEEGRLIEKLEEARLNPTEGYNIPVRTV